MYACMRVGSQMRLLCQMLLCSNYMNIKAHSYFIHLTTYTHTRIHAYTQPANAAPFIALARLEEHRQTHPEACLAPARSATMLERTAEDLRGVHDVGGAGCEEGGSGDVSDDEVLEEVPQSVPLAVAAVGGEADWKGEAERLYRRAILLAGGGTVGGSGTGVDEDVRFLGELAGVTLEEWGRGEVRKLEDRE